MIAADSWEQGFTKKGHNETSWGGNSVFILVKVCAC